ncbi:MAG: ThuA domain-containing protein [Bryobacterales bacterium]|nr:ThuA domain-containing protein [Bryobacterales bacterium]
MLPADAMAADPMNVLIFSGHNNHDWRLTTPEIQKILEDTGRFQVRVTDEPAGVTAAVLARFDLIVLNYCGERWGEPAESAVLDFVRKGKGVVSIHAASYPFGTLEVLGEKMTRTGKREQPWTEYAKLIGASWKEGDPKSGHGKRHAFTVNWKDSAHPVSAGQQPFVIHDELYHHLVMQPDARVLATAFDAKEMNGSGKEEPIIWVTEYGSGRSFHLTLGHDVSAMRAPGFVTALARGAEWAASGKVEGPRVSSAKPIRVQLTTGGHDYEASFYEAFEGDDGLKTIINPHPKAFRPNMLKQVDVLVMYDSVSEVPEPQRKILQQYLESGKGLVLVHHAIVDFPEWEWWWKEVMGGLYLLKPMDGKLSTFKHDVWLDVKKAMDHPVTRGVGDFRIFDETYKNLWISPDAKVLLRVDHPTSDGPVAWISPYPKARVVYVQLGHGREAHRDPNFQRLIRNSIRWAAGRDHW